MKKYLLHKRFTIRGEEASFSKGYWCAQLKENFSPITNQIDSKYKRPDDIHEGA